MADNLDLDAAPGRGATADAAPEPGATAHAHAAPQPGATADAAPEPGATADAARPPAGPRSGVSSGSVVDDALTRLWPESGPRTAPVPLLASLAIGVLAAVILPYRNVGVGVLLVLLLGGALVWAMSPRRTRPWTLLSAALCLALGSFVVLRDAGWLTVLGLVTAAVLVAAALTDARRLAAIAGSAAAWALSAVRGLPLLSRTLGALTRHRLLWPVLRTAALSLVGLVVFGGLFASGDAVFGTWVARLVPDLAWDSLIFRAFVLVAVGGVVLAGCYLALNPPRVEALRAPEPAPVSRAWEWLVPVGLIIAVFVGFVVAQGAAMWGGHDYVRAVTGLSYAEYVHEGFGQLTVATALTLATIAITVRKAPDRTPADRLRLRIALGLLCVLTLVVVASALFRMAVYQQAFGFTVLRVLVDAFELWLGVVVVLVVVAGVRWSGWWLPRAALVAGAGFLLVLGFGNTEAWVAERNIERYAATGKVDTAYLATLSADATPAILDGLPPRIARCVIGPEPESDDLLSWNLGRARAEVAAANTPPLATPCP